MEQHTYVVRLRCGLFDGNDTITLNGNAAGFQVDAEGGKDICGKKSSGATFEHCETLNP
ncbi:hypothetical protein RB200_18970 [Streptomyces sp. PmtG]